MKKLFLFIVILFGILSAQSFANGCSAQICMCPNGGYVSTNQYCPAPSNNNYGGSYHYEMWKAFAYDYDSGTYGVGLNHSKGKAEKEAIQKCGTKGCKIIARGNTTNHAGFVATSSNGVVVGYTTRYGSNRNKVKEQTLKNCQNQGGIDCKIIWSNDADFYK